MSLPAAIYSRLIPCVRYYKLYSCFGQDFVLGIKAVLHSDVISVRCTASPTPALEIAMTSQAKAKEHFVQG
jgi:hypothetical protein